MSKIIGVQDKVAMSHLSSSGKRNEMIRKEKQELKNQALKECGSERKFPRDTVQLSAGASQKRIKHIQKEKKEADRILAYSLAISMREEDRAIREKKIEEGTQFIQGKMQNDLKVIQKTARILQEIL